MQLQEITFLAVVSILEFLQSAANSNQEYTDFTSQNFRKNGRHGRVILHRPIRNNHFQDEQTLYYNRHSQTNGRVPYQNHRDVNRFPSQFEHNRWNRIPFNAGPDSNRQFDRRQGYGYPNNYNTQRKQTFHNDREASIADYVKRYNFENNPRPTFYNGPNDSNFNPPIEEEVIIEDEPEDYKHQTYNFQTDSVHKDLTKATFPGNRVSSGISNFPNKHRFSTGNGPVYEDHRHFYYQKPDFDMSDDSSDKGIDPELFEIYKKVIEVYKKKQNQKKRQGKKPFYFGNQEQNNANTFFLQHNNHPGSNDENNYFHIPVGGKANIPPPHHLKSKGFVFPGPVQSNDKPSPTYPSFQASPQFHKYSEPDPLYHPNGNPFQLHDTSHIPPAPTPLPHATTTSSIPPSTSDVPQQSTTAENNKNFPDSINAQLPPPEKDTDTSIPYVAATVVTPKTSSDTTLSIHAQTLSLAESVSELSTMTSSPPTLHRNETFNLQGKIIRDDNMTSSTVPHIELFSENFKPDNETSSPKAPATGQPDLFFLPTAAEEISGSSSKESPIFQEIVQNFDELNKPTTYRRNYTPSATTLAISTPSTSIIENEIYTSSHTISTSNEDHGQEHNVSNHNVKMDNEIKLGEKEVEVLQGQYLGTKGQKYSQNNILLSEFPVTIEVQNTDIPPTPGSTTFTLQNTTAMNITSIYHKQEYFPSYFTIKNEDSDAIAKSSVEVGKPTESNVRHFANKKQDTLSEKEVENNYSTNSIDLEKQNHATPNNILQTHKPEDNIHYLMSIINQARTHVILSQNGTQEDVLL